MLVTTRSVVLTQVDMVVRMVLAVVVVMLKVLLAEVM